MKITQVESFILHIPVTGNQIADSTHKISHWGVVGAKVTTEAGGIGYGFTGTHAHVASDRLIADCVRHVYGPLLEGEDAQDTQYLWRKLCHNPPVQWIGRAGVTQLALAAVDIALWDLKAKMAGCPLWKLLGGTTKEKLVAYNTDGGWLNFSKAQVVDNCRRFVEKEGFEAIKIKVGLPDPAEDLKRIEAVRQAVGPSIKLAVDGNGKWDLPTALRVVPRFADYDIYWFEEPLWYDDVRGHARLARAVSTPVALGEQLYTADAFREFIQAGAIHYVQPDVTRLGGITEWLQVADMAHACRLPVAAHAGDMGQVHQHTSYAHPACSMLEYIPWIREAFEDPVTVEEGICRLPQLPGAGTTIRPDAFERFAVR